MFALKALQYTCTIVTLMLAFFTFASRFYVAYRDRRFEQSRGMVLGALLVFATHYILQMVFGWRAQGDDVGTLFNLIFYTPASILIACSQLNILTAGAKRRKYIEVGAASYALIAATIGISVAAHGSLHIGGMLYVADALNFATLLYYIWLLVKKLRNVERRIDSEMGNPAELYLHTMRIGLLALCAFAILSPLFILSQPMLFVFGPCSMAALSLFVVSFTALGFNLSAGLPEIVAEPAEESATCKKALPELTEERQSQIEEAINQWRSEGGFKDIGLTLASFTRRIMVNRADFTAYLMIKHSMNFRTWLSTIRVEEAKRLMKEHSAYSNEVVSLECGFSSRVYFQRVFKERTGLTPAEWKSRR